jgi:(S)-2-hydroxy-acid oxidase
VVVPSSFDPCIPPYILRFYFGTVDTPQLGKREPDMRNAFHLPEGLALQNFVEEDKEKEFLPIEGGSSGLAAYVASQIDRSLNWTDVLWLRSITKLPIGNH